MKPNDLWLHRQMIRLVKGIVSAWEEWLRRSEGDAPSKELK
jgi:hypothetical protein